MVDPRYVSHNLTQALGHLIEECGEAMQIAGKTLRFGASSSNPKILPEERETNAAWLLREMRDVEKRIKEVRAMLAAEGHRDTGDGTTAEPELSFSLLRAHNVARLPHFKTRDGKLAHTHPDGSDWSINDWMVASFGELGEAANIAKKIRRGDMPLSDPHTPLRFGEELADAMIYVDIAAFRAGIDLGDAIAQKWNKSSVEIGWGGRLPVRRQG